MRTTTMIALTAALALTIAGCELKQPVWRQDSPPPAAEPVDSEASVTGTPAAEVPAADSGDAIMAMVNGEPIYMRQLTDHLVTMYGARFARLFVANEVVAQRARAENITLTDEEIRQEHWRAIDVLSPEKIDDPAYREQFLDKLLSQRNVSRTEWDMAIRRNLMLNKMATKLVNVTDDDLQDEFDRQYGRRVQVRHIQLPSLAAAQQVLQKLEDGANFIDLVRQHSRSPSRASDGLLPPVSAKTIDVPAALREAALALTTPGELSQPVKVVDQFHLLELVKIFPPQQEDMDAVKDQLYESAYRMQLRMHRETLFKDMMRNADVKYVDPVLRNAVRGAGR
ncbi:MAG: peptidylprolyl isomerase [Planctomycetota bacterium]|jgi:parvulin-like peptidyl-prolyl isomerase